MQCVDVPDRLLVAEPGLDSELDRHVAGCAPCARMARGIGHVDRLLRSTLIVSPPPELQRELANLVLDAARAPSNKPWWARVVETLAPLDPAHAAHWPRTFAAQGLAAVMLALASWQLFGWLSALQPMLGDVSYAVELVIASPAVAYLGGLQLDLQNLVLWSLVGIIGWFLSEDGLIGRRIVSRGLHLP